jgi:Co/Zn/Cd efflux system component
MPCCHDDHCASAKRLNSPRWRRALWIALFINGGFFAAEIIAGLAAGSAALQADALALVHGDRQADSVALQSVPATRRGRRSAWQLGSFD